jgi:hypothetical protein
MVDDRFDLLLRIRNTAADIPQEVNFVPMTGGCQADADQLGNDASIGEVGQEVHQGSFKG